MDGGCCCSLHWAAAWRAEGKVKRKKVERRRRQREELARTRSRVPPWAAADGHRGYRRRRSRLLREREGVG
jgi:hypothetical protein